jgi:hypothetical protein
MDREKTTAARLFVSEPYLHQHSSDIADVCHRYFLEPFESEIHDKIIAASQALSDVRCNRTSPRRPAMPHALRGNSSAESVTRIKG